MGSQLLDWFDDNKTSQFCLAKQSEGIPKHLEVIDLHSK
jgi:hypothetical protein